MPKVHHVTARKDYPEHGIKRGEKYYHWQLYRGRKQYSKTPPTESQLTGSAYISALCGHRENIENSVSDHDSGESLAEFLNEVADEIEALGSEQEEKRDNMPEGLQQSEVGELLGRRAEACTAIADELRGQAENVESVWSDFTDEYGEEDPEQMSNTEEGYARALILKRAGSPEQQAELSAAVDRAWAAMSESEQARFDEAALRTNKNGELITRDMWSEAHSEALTECQSCVDVSNWDVE